MLPTEAYLRKTLVLLIGATRGGPVRLQILDMLFENPRNGHRVSKDLHVDYKTAAYHLRVLEKSGMVIVNKGNAANYTLSPALAGCWEALRPGLGERQINKPREG